MSLVINTNSIATVANRNLVHNQSNLSKSLARLSSGSKLIDPTEDIGGLAVSTKIQAAIHRNIRAQQNVQNAISYLQVQDGAIENAISVLDRLSELKTMSLDPTKNSSDIAVYNNEFGELQKQLFDIYKEKFNEISLFDDDENLISISNENGSDGAVTLSRSGLFDELAEAELRERAIAAASYQGTDGTDTLTLSFTVPTHGLTTTVSLTDGAGIGEVNGSDISAAIKGINDALASSGITTISASEDSSGKLVITGSETFHIAETIAGSYTSTSLAATYDGVAKTYDYNSLGNYNVGDVVSGTRSDGTQESFLISTDVTGNGRTFDEFAALANTTRLDNSLDPSAKVFVSGTTDHQAGDVIYNDDNGRYYLTRGASGTHTSSNTGDIGATSTGTTEFLDLGTELPGVSDYADYDSATDYHKDDIIRHDGNLYVAKTTIGNGEGSPIVNSSDWVRLNVAVTGKNSLLNEDNGITEFSVADLKDFIQTAATTRSINGAQQQRLSTSLELLQTNHTNLVAANSRLADVDVASESTIFAKNNILVQASASMLSQANASLGIALSLLQ